MVLKPLVECVPNFSEGRRPEVVAQIVEAIRAVPGATVLDFSSDADHNRTVVTFVGDPQSVEQAAFAAIATASALINLDEQSGEHPRIGATDVVPFIPLRGVETADCVAMAQRVGERVGRELDIPVYLYESAATRPDRQNLATLRKGEYEGLKEAIQTDPNRAPDFGPSALGTAGATVIGARPFLVAFNVYLNTDKVEIASKIAKSIRHSGGGLRFVKGLGLLVDGQAQVSMNLTDFRRTPMHRVVEMIRSEAARYGVMITHSELIGLIPEDALIDVAKWHLQLDLFTPDQILERRLQQATAEEVASTYATPEEFASAVAAGTAAPGGGAVAAAAGALAAGLAEMVARLTAGKKKYAEVEEQMNETATQAENLRLRLMEAISEDIAAFDQVMEAYKLPKDAEGRAASIQQAMTGAADVPLVVAQTALEAMKLAGLVATQGNLNAVTDAMGGIHMALAAVEIAALNVKINVSSFTDLDTVASYTARINTVLAQARTLSSNLLSQSASRADLTL